MKKFRLPILIASLFLLLSLTTINAQIAKDEKQNSLVPREHFGKWESARNVLFSDDNNWAGINISTNDSDYTIQLKQLRTGEFLTFENASSLNFSPNSKWITYSVMLPGKEAKKLKKSKKPVPNKMALFNLSTKDTVFFADVKSRSFSGNGDYLSLYRVKDSQNTLIIRTLKSGKEISFGNVKNFAWQPKGNLLAFSTHTKDKAANTVQLYNPENNTLTSLDSEASNYISLTWAEDNDDLLVVKEVKDDNYDKATNTLLVWNDLSGKAPAYHNFNQDNFKSFHKDWYVTTGGIQISKNGDRVFFNIFDRHLKANKKESDSTKTDSDSKDKWHEEAPALEIWNSKDELVITQQKVSTGKGIDQPRQAVWNIKDNSFYVLIDGNVETVTINKDNTKFIGLDQEPYRFESLFGRPSYDLYLVDAEKGTQKLLVKNVAANFDLSPDANYFVYVKDDHLHLFDITKMSSRNLTEGIDAEFINNHNDHPVPQKPAYGFGGWSEDSKSFLLYSEFDVWQFHPTNNKITKITDGKASNIIYRVNYPNRWGPKEFNPKDVLTFSMSGKLTKDSGYAQGKLGGQIKTLIYEPARINIAGKSEDESMMSLVKMRYDESPTFYVTNQSFENPSEIFKINTFLKDYKWGKAELVNYTNALGNEAQGILYYPADYVKGKKYPMITYIYETLSANLNNFIAPSETSYYNTTVWSQNGYFVFNPDIEFEAGNPGVSSARTLEKAVAAVIEKGDVDPNKVGLIGHSWGGYQAGFVPTQTDIFAASVAGAGLTNLISMNLAITPAFRGSPENNHFEVGQERMVTSPWLAPEKYIENSSVMQVHKLNTPILFEVGDNDMNVNWRQGVEYYNAARRANKDFILLVYAKEGHGLREPKNQIDYQKRILEWFDHYLKGAEAKDWIKEGIPYNEQERQLKAWGK